MVAFVWLPISDIETHFKNDQSLHGHHYSYPKEFEALARCYHVSGWDWPDLLMAKYFTMSLLQYYVFDVLQLAIAIPNHIWQTTYETAPCKRTAFKQHNDFCQLLSTKSSVLGWENVKNLTDMARQITEIPALLNAGVEYLRLRNIQEYLFKHDAPYQDDVDFNELQLELAASGYKLQAIIYNWVRYVRYEMLNFIKTNKDSLNFKQFAPNQAPSLLIVELHKCLTITHEIVPSSMQTAILPAQPNPLQLSLQHLKRFLYNIRNKRPVNTQNFMVTQQNLVGYHDQFTQLLNNFNNVTTLLGNKSTIDSRYTNIAQAAKTLSTGLATAHSQFVKIINNCTVSKSKDALTIFKHTCDQLIQATTREFAQHRHFWYQIHPILRKILGVLAAFGMLFYGVRQHQAIFFQTPAPRSFKHLQELQQRIHAEANNLQFIQHAM